MTVIRYLKGTGCGLVRTSTTVFYEAQPRTFFIKSLALLYSSPFPLHRFQNLTQLLRLSPTLPSKYIHSTHTAMDNEKDTLPAYTRFSTPKLSWRVPATSMRTPEQQFELDLEALKNDGELARIGAESDEDTRKMKIDLFFLTIKLLIFTVAAVYILRFLSDVLATRALQAQAVVKTTPAAKVCFSLQKYLLCDMLMTS